ncbi:MAG TPA: hypothetical protein VN761_01205 [Candidatus Polarisedimenticolia bacterium]|nr:hypothetical protein [Candidatus Polarisedimenticolia bacterium]
MNKGKPGGKSGAAKGGSRRARGKTSQRTPHPGKGAGLGPKRGTTVHPAGRGGPSQWAGGPQHHGLDPSEDRNP